MENEKEMKNQSRGFVKLIYEKWKGNGYSKHKKK